MAVMLEAANWRAPSSGSAEVAQTALSFGGYDEMDAPAGWSPSGWRTAVGCGSAPGSTVRRFSSVWSP